MEAAPVEAAPVAAAPAEEEKISPAKAKIIAAKKAAADKLAAGGYKDMEGKAMSINVPTKEADDDPYAESKALRAKIDELKEKDLFPLALSCRYFRQKQKELVAHTRQNEPWSRKPPLALKTIFCEKPAQGQPASADYIRFGSTLTDWWWMYHIDRIRCTSGLVAYHDDLPLLKELLQAGLEPGSVIIISEAGESSSLWFRFFLLVF